jgi:hypothetical protein
MEKTFKGVNRMKKLKPCPICGSEDIKTQSGTGVDLNTQYNGKYVYCNNCKLFKQVSRYSEWNSRPESAWEMFRRLDEDIHNFRYLCKKKLDKRLGKKYHDTCFDFHNLPPLTAIAIMQQIEKELEG